MSTVYDFTVKNYKGEVVQLSDYIGKVLVIVNTASKCGFTGQYAQLQELYDKYNEKGLEIIAFPCNQFGEQEKGSDEEIHSFCQMNFGLSFPVYSKIDVNGENEHPLYTYLKDEKKGLIGRDIKWNFTKFIISREGTVVKRVSPQTNPLKMTKEIEKLLG